MPVRAIKDGALSSLNKKDNGGNIRTRPVLADTSMRKLEKLRKRRKKDEPAALDNDKTSNVKN